MVNTLCVRLVLLGLVFVALWVVTVGYVVELRHVETLSYVVIRDELDIMFVRWALFIGDVVTWAILFSLAPAALGAIISNLVTGHMSRPQALAFMATLVTITAAGVSGIATKMSIDKHFAIPWLVVVIAAVGGLAQSAGGPVGRSSDGRAHQSPGRGRVLTVLGWTLGALALSVALIGGPLYGDLVSVADLPSWVPPLIAVAVVVPALLLSAVSAVLLKRGRRHRHRIIPSFEELAGERYLLYLRPFAIDRAMAFPPDEAPGWSTRSPFELPGTHEEFLLRPFRRLGRVVAIGQPGERLPELGAERGYLPVDDWQDMVSRLIHGAHAVIMTAVPGPGTMWEFTEALRTTAPVRLLLLIYGDELYHAFREGAAQEYASRSSAETDVNWPPLPHLPEIPPPAPHTRGLPWDFPLKGILSFDHEWRPRFTRFPPAVPRLRHVWTIRRLVRRELTPVLQPLSQLAPAPPFA
ncbi:hypothetical protein FH608_038785 [Nonomuraea phyllanthi]|uniref:Uncharacterized protein n=1 Tax=Nonomuraea phyllanthi TaxID=2219224 RepID=A0A5C4VNW0_9ACTN|nr:hypothetical protein [Nonomuraea phyllanthi]KAB8189545.1 hypothetical protein FH608_038785 [Nonomuraea phyllanthi]